MLKREMYLRQIRPFYDSDIIKVITGVRRAGKSVILESIRDELAERKISADQMIYINLEDLEYSYILNAKDLNNEIKGRIKGNAKYYIFLDEIQHIQNFQPVRLNGGWLPRQRRAQNLWSIVGSVGRS